MIFNNEEKLDCVEGTVERIVYANEENGYSVVRLIMPNDEEMTIVGVLPYITEGEIVTAYGSYTTHPKFGRQFAVEYYEKQLPQTESAIYKYLASRTIKGIGPISARKIVDHFGTESFDIIENHPDMLADINGITPKKAQAISEDFKKQHGMRSVIMFCREFFGMTTSVNVYKRWGNSSVDMIKANPYMLCDEELGVSFDKADKIARSLGIPPNNSDRIQAALKYVLMHNANQNGHIYVPEEKLLKAVGELLKTDENENADALEALISRLEVVVKKYGGRRVVYLKKYYDAEQYTADKLRLLDEKTICVGSDNVNHSIGLMELADDIKYAPKQREAIRLALDSGVMILTGGPGTGKTTIIKALIKIFTQMDFNVALAAPTGRAAKRMSDATSCEAKTIHRLLEMGFGDGDEMKFMRCESNLLDENVIIVDEASMIDILLMQSLLKAIKPGAKLILIGDSDQLPSVGAGYVLNDMIASERFATVQLTEIFRQARESLIITNAHAINNGEYPDLTVKDNDFFFIQANDEEKIAGIIADLCKRRLPKTYGEDIVKDIQIITPSRKGYPGTVMLNARLQAVLNPPMQGKKEKKIRDFILRVGDKVMQVKNNYDIMWEKDGKEGSGIFNGDIGTIIDIDNVNAEVRVDFDGKSAVYHPDMLDQIEHAYAVTVHKSQGSEYPVVIMPLYSAPSMLLTRNMFYTAVTRAQKMVILVGSTEIACKMVDNNRQALRYTSLADVLKP